MVNHDLPAPIVLIVEDEWLILAEIAEEFQRAGWTVLEANTGESSVALAQNGQRIDAVVTAIQLAGYLSGWDVADAFRALNPDIPVSRRRRAHPFHLFDRTDPRLDRAFGTMTVPNKTVSPVSKLEVRHHQDFRKARVFVGTMLPRTSVLALADLTNPLGARR